MPIDPYTPLPLTPEARAADRLAALERRLAALERDEIAKHFVGEIAAHARASTPLGWLLCDGAAVSRATYKALFDAIGTHFGAGNGSTTFNVPDLKGRVVTGVDTGQAEFDLRGETGGAKTHTLTVGQLPNHNHKGIVGWGAGANFRGQAGTNLADYGVDNIVYDTLETNGTVPSGGRGQSHNNLQPYMALPIIIYTGAIGL